MNELCQLIREDMRPALGVTEPAAIALACAKARTLSQKPVKRVMARVNSGIYKNAFTCGIPGTSEVGNAYSAALGVLCGDAEQGLCVLEHVTEEDVSAARAMIEAGMVRVEIDSISSQLYISAVVETEHDTCQTILQGGHTNICHIEKNGEVLFHKDFTPTEETRSPIVKYQIAQLFSFAQQAPLEKLLFMEEAYKVNGELAQSGAQWECCVITKEMIRQNGGGLLSDDARMSAKALACAAAEARVLGIDKAAMSITGSGTHGIICTLPLQAYCQVIGIEREQMLRATAISYLVTMYMKEFSGKLSAFCGCGIAGGTGLACALAYLMGGDEEALNRTIDNMAAAITGMICTGGNHCCCLKVVSAVDCAFTASSLAVHGAAVGAPHGICERTPEQTIKNVGLIADPGMVETERMIVDIMEAKE